MGDIRFEEEMLKIIGNYVFLLWEVFIYIKLCWNMVNNSWFVNIYIIFKVLMFLFIYFYLFDYVMGEMFGYE